MSTIPNLNDLARYRPEIAELTERVRAGDADAIARARVVLAELNAVSTWVDTAFHEAGGRVVEAPGGELVYALAGDVELSVLIDEVDEPERTRRLWNEIIEPDLRARGASDAEIEAERIACEVPA